jgi:hypothetical protein
VFFAFQINMTLSDKWSGGSLEAILPSIKEEKYVSKFFISSTLAAVSLVSACAQQPSAIAPAEVSRSAYSGSSCNSLKTNLYEVETKLGHLNAAQTAEANKDTAWVAGGLLFVPIMLVAAGGPDHAGEIATLKGQKNALTAQMVATNC